MFSITWKKTLAATVAVLGLGFFAMTPLASADQHVNGHTKVLSKGNGKHHLHTSGHGHVSHAHVNNGRVQTVSVVHKGKNVGIKKMKTKRKLHAMADFPEGGQFTLAGTGDAVNILAAADGSNSDANVRSSAQFFMYVGFAFFNQFDGQWYIFWFPVNAVEGGASGATDIDGGA